MMTYESREWQRLYRKALSERNPEALPADIARAEAAIRSRLKQLAAREGDEDERHAMSSALSSLSVLKSKHFPGWNAKRQ